MKITRNQSGLYLRENIGYSPDPSPDPEAPAPPPDPAASPGNAKENCVLTMVEGRQKSLIAFQAKVFIV